MTGYVYMTASQKRGTIYIRVTNSLGRQMPEHREGKGSRFTAKYGVQRLVWYEEHFDIRDAIQREKSLKRWLRQWKIDLTERANPDWNELSSAGAGIRSVGCCRSDAALSRCCKSRAQSMHRLF